MIKVSIIFDHEQFKNLDELKDFANKLVAVPQIVPYINACKSYKTKDVNYIIDDAVSRHDPENIMSIIVAWYLIITTQSRKTIIALNDFAKQYNYKYSIWDSGGRMHLDLDELLENF